MKKQDNAGKYAVWYSWYGGSATLQAGKIKKETESGFTFDRSYSMTSGIRFKSGVRIMDQKEMSEAFAEYRELDKEWCAIKDNYDAKFEAIIAKKGTLVE